MLYSILTLVEIEEIGIERDTRGQISIESAYFDNLVRKRWR